MKLFLIKERKNDELGSNQLGNRIKIYDFIQALAYKYFWRIFQSIIFSMAILIERKISKFYVLIRTKMLIIAWIYLMMVKIRGGKEEQSEKMTSREARVVRTDNF